MGKYNTVKSTAFNELQKDAGMILSQFDPTGQTPIADEHILFTTTGGINPTCKPTISDWGEDVDGVPNGTMELMEIDEYECGLGFTALNVTEESVRYTLGAADAEGGVIQPRMNLKKSDFKDVWWVGPLTNGGFAACCLKNAFSAEGFSLQTTKKGKGTVAVSLKGHYSINATDEVPMTFYVIDGEENAFDI